MPLCLSGTAPAFPFPSLAPWCWEPRERRGRTGCRSLYAPLPQRSLVSSTSKCRPCASQQPRLCAHLTKCSRLPLECCAHDMTGISSTTPHSHSLIIDPIRPDSNFLIHRHRKDKLLAGISHMMCDHMMGCPPFRDSASLKLAPHAKKRMQMTYGPFHCVAWLRPLQGPRGC